MTNAGKAVLGIGSLFVAGLVGIATLPTVGAFAAVGGMWAGMHAVSKHYKMPKF